MYLLTFEQDQELRLGVKRPGGVLDVRALAAETNAHCPLDDGCAVGGRPSGPSGT
jgi:hypothetical protein